MTIPLEVMSKHEDKFRQSIMLQQINEGELQLLGKAFEINVSAEDFRRIEVGQKFMLRPFDKILGNLQETATQYLKRLDANEASPA